MKQKASTGCRGFYFSLKAILKTHKGGEAQSRSQNFSVEPRHSPKKQVAAPNRPRFFDTARLPELKKFAVEYSDAEIDFKHCAGNKKRRCAPHATAKAKASAQDKMVVINLGQNCF